MIPILFDCDSICSTGFQDWILCIFSLSPSLGVASQCCEGTNSQDDHAEEETHRPASASLGGQRMGEGHQGKGGKGANGADPPRCQLEQGGAMPFVANKILNTYKVLFGD